MLDVMSSNLVSSVLPFSGCWAVFLKVWDFFDKEVLYLLQRKCVSWAKICTISEILVFLPVLCGNGKCLERGGESVWVVSFSVQSVMQKLCVAGVIGNNKNLSR